MFKEIIVALFTFNILLHRTHKKFFKYAAWNSKVERDFSYVSVENILSVNTGATGLLWIVSTLSEF